MPQPAAKKKKVKHESSNEQEETNEEDRYSLEKNSNYKKMFLATSVSEAKRSANVHSF